MSSQDDSQDIVSHNDSVNRVYICYCEKKYTTYPGVYLHLKAKHVQFFQKYKKLKITRLFRKTQSSEGSEVYKLQKVSEIDNNPNNFSKKKQQEQKKKTPPPAFPIIEPSPHPHQKSLPSEHHHKQKQMPNNFLNFQFHTDFSRNDHRGVMLPPSSNGVPMYLPHFQVPPYVPYNPMMMGVPKPTIKKVFQKFFLEFNVEKVFLRKVIHKLSVFIDEKYQSTKDPRVKDRLFLSYCDSFDTFFLGPLLQEKLWKLNEERCQGGNERKKQLDDQIDILKQLKLWLFSSGLINELLGSQNIANGVEIKKSKDNDYVSQDKSEMKMKEKEE